MMEYEKEKCCAMREIGKFLCHRQGLHYRMKPLILEMFFLIVIFYYSHQQ